MTLGQLSQTDFAAGMVRVAPHLLPSNAAWEMENFLLSDDGSAYKRSGSEAISNAPFDDGIEFLWDGDLAGGHRTVFASGTGMGTLDVDGVTPIDFATGGVGAPMRPASIEGLLFVGSWCYGGSRLVAAPYTAGTLAVTEGDETVVGTGTNWDPNVDPGTVLNIGGRLMAVRAVTDDTHLELVMPFPGATASGLSYTAASVQAIPATYHPNGIYAAVAGRLLSADGDRVYESKGGDSTTWDVTEYQQFPGGEIPSAIEGLRDVAYVLTTGGIWAITNVPYDLTDDAGNPQQTLERISGDIVLWEAAGLAFWEDQIVVPALDGVWLFGRGAPEPITRSIEPYYAELVRDGHHCGLADVDKGHYCLPILDGAGDPVLVLVCRLDRPVRIYRMGTVYPWTTLTGPGVAVTCFANRVAQPPMLLAAEAAGDARVLRIGAFTPDGLALDHEDSIVETLLTSRDTATGGSALNVNYVKKLRMRYELTGQAEVEASIGSDARPPDFLWDSGTWDGGVWVSGPEFAALDATAPPSEGDTPFTWWINENVRYFRVTLRTVTPATRFVVRSLELFVRPSGRM